MGAPSNAEVARALERALPALAYACQRRAQALDELYGIISGLLQRSGVSADFSVGFVLNRWLLSQGVVDALKKAGAVLSYGDYRRMADWYERWRGALAESSALALLIRAALRLDLAEAASKVKLGWLPSSRLASLRRLRELILGWHRAAAEACERVKWDDLPASPPPPLEGFIIKLRCSRYVGELELCIADPPEVPEYPAKRKMMAVQYFASRAGELPSLVDYAISAARGGAASPPALLRGAVFVDRPRYAEEEPVSAAFTLCRQVLASLVALYDDVFIEPIGPRLDRLPYGFLLRALGRQLRSELPAKLEGRDELPLKDSDAEWTVRYALMLLM